MVRQFPDATTLNLGGGYKVARMADEKTTDLARIGAPILEKFQALQAETGRAIRLEIEPGTFLLANSCSLVTTIQDMVNTGGKGYHFLKLDAGMTEILRPALYASQHPIIVVPAKETSQTVSYVVVGHCCESGDLLTPSPENHEELAPRELPGRRSAIFAWSRVRALTARRCQPRITTRSRRRQRCYCARTASWW